MYSSVVITGISATIPTKTTSSTSCGVRSSQRRAVPRSPRRTMARSSARATHSSTPICGEVAGDGPGGVGIPALTSHLLQHGRAADARRSEEHEDDQDRKDDQ